MLRPALLLLLLAACSARAQSDASPTTSPAPTSSSAAPEDAVVVGDRRGGYYPRRPGGGGGGGYGNSHEQQKRSPLQMEYGWKKMDFVFPNDHARSESIRVGKYNYTSIIALDVDVWEKAGRKKVFITMPGGDGVPATLGTVSSQGDPHAPLVAPYPDWSWHRKGDCRSISSVYRVAIDDYDRLWVLDRGDDNQCLPKLMTFDLNNDRLLSKYEFAANLMVNKSNLITPVLDVRDGGRNTFVYIADVIGGIIVYDHQSKSAWRVNHPTTLPDLQYANHNIAGSRFYLPDGVFGMALSPLQCEGPGSATGATGERGGRGYSHGEGHGGHGHNRCEEDRTLYYHALASVRENYVKTSVLRNRDNFRHGQNKAASKFHTFENNRPWTSAASAMSEQGVLFTGLLPEMALMCWNTAQPFAGWNIELVASDQQTLQFTSGLKVRHGRLWVMSCRYQRFITNTMNWNEVNYRVQSARVSDLLRGKKCDPKTNTIG